MKINKILGLAMVWILGSLCLLSATFGALEDDVYFYSTLTTNANDEVNSNDLTNSGVTFSSEGAYFGGNDYFTFPSQFANVFTNSFTISTNIKYSSFESDSLTGCQLYFKEDSSHTHQCIENRNGNGFGYYTYSADGRGGTDKNGEPSSNTWYNETLVYDESTYTMTFYVNGVQKWTSTGSSGIGSVNTMRFGAMAWSGLDNYLTGYVKNMAIFDRALSSTEVTELQNNGLFGADTPTIQTNLSEFYNIQNISIQLNTTTNTNMSYSLDNGTLTSICNNCNNSILNLNSLSEGSHSILFESTDSNGQVNSSANFTIDLTDPTISISNSTELNSYEATWSNFFNYSDTNLDTCYLIVENSSQNCSSYTFSENGNQSVQIYVNDSAGNMANENFTLFVNPYQYFYFEEPSSSPISNFTLGGNSYENYAAIKTYDLGLGDQNLSFVKYGYATTPITFNLNTTSEINLTTEIQIALLYISIYDVETLALINQQVNINLIGTDFAGSFSTSNGTITITNITDLPDTYELDLSSSGYEDLTYYFTHTGYAAVELSLYMQNTSTTVPIKYIVLDTFGDPYDLSTCLIELQIYQISSNSYESFVMDYTNSIAEVIFNLDTSEKYKPIVTCGSQTQVYDGGKITSTPVYLKFSQSSLEVFPTVPTISSDITFVEVSNTTGRFKFTYNDLNNIISQACLNVTVLSYTDETLVDTQCLSSSSGSINVDFNTTAGLTYKAYGLVKYEGQFYEVDTYYKKIPVAEFDFGIWGVIFGLVITGMLGIAGFFMGKAKGVLIGTTAGLWIMSLAVFGVWYLPVSAPLIMWSVLLILGVIFT